MRTERDLLREIVTLYVGVSCDPNMNKLLLEAEELLTQPAIYEFTTQLDQGTIMYQFRSKFDRHEDWGHWLICSKDSYEDYKNHPTWSHHTYQTREFHVSPQQAESKNPICWLTTFGEDKCIAWTQPDRYQSDYFKVFPLYM